MHIPNINRRIFEEILWDDAILFSFSTEKHASNLEQVLERFGKAKLDQPPGKCVFALPEMQYFSYLIIRDGIFHPLRRLVLYMNPLYPGLLKISGHS
jgi:hypothetical protein